MSESNKRTERKSQGVRSRHHHNAENEHANQSSRVMDMSWAAKYLDDDWEGKYSKNGGYDTKANAHAQAGASRETVDMMSQTQEFTPVNSDEPEDELKIRDAVTDRTIVSLDAVSAVRSAVSMEDRADDETDLKIRDAATDKTIVSVEAVSKVRNAVSTADEEDDETDLKIRDAATDKTIVSVDAVSKVRGAASTADEEDDETDLKIRDAVTDKTIASASQVEKVRNSKVSKDAAMSAALDEDLADLDNIRDARSSKTGKAAQAPKKAAARKKTKSAPVSATGLLNGIIGDKSKKKAPDVSATDILNGVIVAAPLIEDDYPAAGYPEEEYTETQDEIYEDRTAPIRRSRPDRPGRSRSANRRPEDDDIRIRETRDRRDRERPRKDRDRYAGYNDYYYVQSKSPLRFIPLVLVIALCVLGFITARIVTHDVPVNASDYSKISYTVAEGLTDETLSHDLRDLGLIDNPLVFRLRCLFYDADYIPGTYELSPCYSTEKIVNILSGYKYGDE